MLPSMHTAYIVKTALRHILELYESFGCCPVSLGTDGRHYNSPISTYRAHRSASISASRSSVFADSSLRAVVSL